MNQNQINVVRGHIDDASHSFNNAALSLGNLSEALPQIFPAPPPAPALPPAIIQIQQDIQQIQQDLLPIQQIPQIQQTLQGIQQTLQGIQETLQGIQHQNQLLNARVANGSFDHLPGNNIDWPNAPPVAAGQPALPPLPQQLPATWAAVKNSTAAELDIILHAYNVPPAPTIEEKLKQIQHYIGLRLFVNVND